MTDAAPPAESAAALGVTQATHDGVSKELIAAQKEIAMLRARTELIDSEKQESISSMKPAVSELVKDIMSDESFAPYTRNMKALPGWADSMDSSTDAIDTNLSFSTLLSCASAKLKRTRDEASAGSEKVKLLAETLAQLEETKAALDGKVQRISELEGLVESRTKAAAEFQERLARADLLEHKMDFSSKSGRENVPTEPEAVKTEPLSAVTSNASGKQPMKSQPPLDTNSALLGFMTSAPSNAGLKIVSSATNHHLLGTMGTAQDTSGVLAAIRGY
jgi:hypothetical protein